MTTSSEIFLVGFLKLYSWSWEILFGSIIYLLFPKTEKRPEVSRDRNHTKSEQVLPVPGVGVGWCPACPIPVLGNRDWERWRRQAERDVGDRDEKQRQRQRWERDRQGDRDSGSERWRRQRWGWGSGEIEHKQAPENPPGRGPREPGSPGWGGAQGQ